MRGGCVVLRCERRGKGEGGGHGSRKARRRADKQTEGRRDGWGAGRETGGGRLVGGLQHRTHHPDTATALSASEGRCDVTQPRPQGQKASLKEGATHQQAD